MDTLTIQLIKNIARQAFGALTTVTSFSKLIQLVQQKHPTLNEDCIKNAMADIEGWYMAAGAQEDEIELTPLFFC